MDKYGQKIREIREKNNDTREQLAKKIGLSGSGLGKIERGERQAKPSLLEKISDLYEVPLSFFYGEETNIPKELKEIGVEWITFAKEMKERELTPEQIKSVLDMIRNLGLDKKT